MVTKYLIYALIDPRTEQVRYVGQSSCGMKRPRMHSFASVLHKDGHTAKACWIRSLQQLGLEYRIAILDMLPEPAGLDELEQYWIARGRASGWPLLNHRAGGETGRGHYPSEETRRKIGEASARNWRDPVYRQRVLAACRGVKRSAETRARMSEAQRGNTKGSKTKGRVVSPETRAKIRAALLGRHRSAEAIAKTSAANLGKPRPEWVRTKISAGHMRRRQQQQRGGAVNVSV